MTRDRLTRRDWLKQGRPARCAGGRRAGRRAGGQGQGPGGPHARAGRRILYVKEDLAAWLAGRAFPFSKYDPELGYLHIDRDFKEGLDGAVCPYRYDRLGARRTIAHADKPCRINTYGNSFTSCEQVSDGETWQEVLAAHLGEPVRNYGIGGYSVYQAYLRMQREEKRAPAQYIIFNIFDDDHYRNLHGWQRLRFGVNRKSTNPPMPYVRVDPDTGTFEELPNPCPTRGVAVRAVRLGRGLEAVQGRLPAGPLRGPRAAPGAEGRGRARHGLRRRRARRAAPCTPARGSWRRWRSSPPARTRRVLYVLSYNPQTVRRQLQGKPRVSTRRSSISWTGGSCPTSIC